MVQYSRIIDEINMAASRYDGRKTMPYFAMLSLAAITYFIFPLVWFTNFSSRVGSEARRRGYDTKFGVADFWLWNILGSLIIVEPFVYLHKLTKSMNMVNTSYNYYG